MNNRKRTLIAAASALAFLLVIVISALISMRGTSLFGNRKSVVSESEAASWDSVDSPETDEFLSPYGVFLIEDIDRASSGITLFGVETGTTLMLRYTPGSDVRNSYGKIISTALLRPGLYCSVSYNSEDGTLSSMTLSDRIWCFRRVTKTAIDKDLRKITLSGSIYRYDDSLHVFSDGTPISLDDISTDDVLTICGVGNYMYSIEVTRGHGTLSLLNDEDFIDCRLYYDLEKYTPVTPGMELVLPEGRYDIIIVDGPVEVNESVIINRGKSTTLNLFKYASVALPHGNLHLNVSPSDADIFIDGMYFENPNDIRITYGDHELLISAEDYIDYEGTVSIANADTTVSISLSVDPFAGFFSTNDYDDDDDYDYFYGSDGEYEDPADENPYGEHTSSNKPNIYVSRGVTNDSNDSSAPSGGETAAKIPAPSEPEKGSSSSSDSINSENSGKKGESTAPPSTRGNNGNHRMTFNFAHDGAEVYLNDTYAGTIRNGSLTVGKIPGIYDISFYVDGSEYSTFTIEVGDGDEDDVFSFPG